MKKYFLLALFCCPFFKAFAQTDVSINVQIMPPYSTYVNDYTGIPGRVMFNMTSNLGTADIKLKAVLSGDNGVTVTTKGSYSPAVPIHLDQLIMVSFTGNDLKKYLDMNNVDVSGINKNELFKGSGLPEGNYTLCLEAYDFATGQLVSLQNPIGCSAPFEIKYLDPPQLVAPMCDDSIFISSPQNLVFSWLPPAGAPVGVSYIFRMVELIPKTRNPDEALNSATTPEFYKVTLNTTNLIYGPSAPLLQPGHKYAWKVVATDQSVQALVNRQPVYHFSNGGSSIACAFDCVQGISLVSTNPSMSVADIHLVFPKDGATVQSEMHEGHPAYKFQWSGVSLAHACNVWAYEMLAGQSAADAVKNNAGIKLVTNKTEENKGVNEIYLVDADYKLDIGKKYAWIVQQDDGKRSVETWVFNMPPAGKFDNVKITKFSMNGFTVLVDSVVVSKLVQFTGYGRVFLFSDQMGGPMAKVSFGVTLVNQEYNEQTGPSDWIAVNGNCIGDVKNFGEQGLYDKNYAGGDFTLIGKAIKLNAKETAEFNPVSNKYTVTQGSPDSYSYLLSRITWITELIPASGNKVVQQGGGDGEGGTPTTSYKIVSIEDYVNFTHSKKFYGTLSSKFYLPKFELKYPANFFLSVTAVSFTLFEKEISCKIAGVVTVPDARDGIDKDLTINFTEATGFRFGAKIPTYTLPLNYFNPGDNKIHTDLFFDTVYVSLCPGGGCEMPDYTVVVHLQGSDMKTVFHHGYNKGYGYFGQDGQNSTGTYKLNTFDVTTEVNYFTMKFSFFVSFQTTGHMTVPFINQNAAVVYTVDVDGFGKGGVFFKDGVASTIYDNSKTNDRLDVTPFAANLLEDRIVLDADFLFTNEAGKNVSLPKISITQMFILADGTVGWYKNPGGEHGAKMFTNQGISGTFNSFTFKPNMLWLDYKNNVYKFTLTGPLVLEDALTTQSDFSVYISYAVPLKKNEPAYDDVPSYTASVNESELWPSELNGTGISFSAEDVNTTTSAIVATAQKNGLMNFGNASFTYFEKDDTYGTGFVANLNIDVKNPFDGQIFGKVIVGHKDNYSYFYIAGGQEGAQESPTGVFDIVISGFTGRIYHHMYHKDKGGILKDDYIPWDKVGYGAYGEIIMKTKASNGAVFWAKGGVEVQTNNGGSLFPITIEADGYLLSSGVNSTNGILNGHAFLQIFPTDKYIHGQITVKGNVLGFLKISGTVDVVVSTKEIHYFLGMPESPLNVTIVGAGTTVSGFYGVELKSGGYREFAGASGYLFNFSRTWSGNIGYDPIDCSWEVGADAYLHGSIYAECNIPFNGSSLPNISGQVALHAHAGIHGSLCGLSQGIGIGGTLSGGFAAPNPFCVAGYAELEMPSILPNLALPFRFKNGSIAFKSSCN